MCRGIRRGIGTGGRIGGRSVGMIGVTAMGMGMNVGGITRALA